MVSDDFLRELVQKSTPDNPSEAFVDKVMQQIRQAPELSPVKGSFYIYLKSALPLIGLVGIIVLFLISSDLPFANNLFGTGNFNQTVMFYFYSLADSIRVIFAWKFFSFGIMVLLAGGILVLIDQIFSRGAKDFFLSKGL